ncbi:MAG: ACT domain-containing protein [Thermodesulfovibrionales bacterium]|nr:ACT domain-containing protein [Thermodesulfovibrionales bacterium]
MKVKQISIFLENKKGHLLQVLDTLGKANINIRALSIADTSEFGILRIIVPDVESAKKALKKAGVAFNENDVFAVAVSDTPGGLAKALKILSDNDINVEYLHAFVTKSAEKAVVVLKTEDIDKSIKILKKANISIIPPKEIYEL